MKNRTYNLRVLRELRGVAKFFCPFCVRAAQAGRKSTKSTIKKLKVMLQFFMEKEHQMKKVAILFIALGVWSVLCPWERVYAADDLMSAAGIFRLNEKPKAPDFKLEDVEGNPVELADFRDKIVLLFFWATW